MSDQIFGTGRPANQGPYSKSDLAAPQELVDFGCIAFVPNPLVGVRAEIEEGTQRIVAISFDFQDSTLQVQAFASPKGRGIWEEVLEDISTSLSSQGVAMERHAGPFGIELHADIPIGDTQTKTVRMFGVDGDRWLLRGTISGSAVSELTSKAELEDIFRGIVVDRGEVPLPPRELLPLNLPAGAIVPKAN
jgi:hypothetical protein